MRLGKNISSYLGETIDIERVLGDLDALARQRGWDYLPIEFEDVKLLTFRRTVPSPRKRLYISSGIHGDEPAGPLALLELLRATAFPSDVAAWMVPCLNPWGFRNNRREDQSGLDLNRDYRAMQSAVVRAHVRWLEAMPTVDLSLCLHEDWEANGFYLYELNPGLKPSCASRIIERVQTVCPIDTSSSIEGRAARNGIICANPDLQTRQDWPEAFHLIHYKTRLSYTFESPSDFSLETRVKALVAGMEAMLDAL